MDFSATAKADWFLFGKVQVQKQANNNIEHKGALEMKTKVDLSGLIAEREAKVFGMRPKSGKLGLLICQPDDNTKRYVKAKTKDFPKMGHAVITKEILTDSFEDNYNALKWLMEHCDSVVIQEPHPHSARLNKVLQAEERGNPFKKGLDIENYAAYNPTTLSVLQILDYYKCTHNETIAVLGAGFFGRDISRALIENKYTVLSCNSRTQSGLALRDMADYTVLVYGNGTLKPIWNESIIDVSFNIEHIPDCKYEYTPIVGGTGRLTTLNLLESFNRIMGEAND